MPLYRVHRMKQTPRESFRWAAHTGGLAIVKPKDYDLSGEIESPTPYSAWKSFSSSDSPLAPGDLLETLGPEGVTGDLLIAKYIGFEPAKWWMPEPRPEMLPASSEAIGGSTRTL